MKQSVFLGVILFTLITIGGCFTPRISQEDCRASGVANGGKLGHYSAGSAVPIVKPFPTVVCDCVYPSD